MSKTYQKFRCVNCGHEFISGANKPRCSKCYSTRLNKIDQFSLEKQLKPKEKQEVKPMPQPIKEPIKPKEEEKPKPKKEEEEQDDIDEMLGF